MNFEGEVNNVELDKENAQGSNMNTIESSRFISYFQFSSFFFFVCVFSFLYICILS